MKATDLAALDKISVAVGHIETAQHLVREAKSLIDKSKWPRQFANLQVTISELEAAASRLYYLKLQEPPPA